MKNKIVIIVFIISILLLIAFSVFGFKLGKLEIPSVKKIIEKNKEVNEQIDKQSNLTTTTYPNTIETFEKTADNLKLEKEKYEQVVGFENGESMWYETEQYDIAYLWKQLGRLATKHKVDIAIDVKKASGTDMYDLYFTIQADYTTISTFIKKIEDDSTLLFRIYNFKLVPGQSTVKLKCTFAVKDVRIDPKTLIKDSGAQTTDNNNNNNDNTNNNTSNNNTTDNNSIENNNQVDDNNYVQ